MGICPITGRVCDQNKIFDIMSVNDGLAVEHSLCHHCASAYFNDEAIPQIEQPKVLIGTGSSEDMLKTMIKMMQTAVAKYGKDELRVKSCPNCKATIESITANGRLGCTKCFQFFSSELIPLLKKISNATEVNSIHDSIFQPKYEIQNNKTLQSTKVKLEHDLKKSIENQNYEESLIIQSKLKIIQQMEQERLAIQEKIDQAVSNSDFNKANLLRKTLIELEESFETRIPD